MPGHFPTITLHLATALTATALFSPFMAGQACADIYRYTNDDGIVCFTDSPSHDQGATVHLKEPAKQLRVKKNVKGPRSGNAAVTTTNALETLPERSPALPLQGRVTSLVGMRHDPINGVLRNHQGVDIAVPSGTPVRPIASGTVIFSGPRNGYGNLVSIEHDDGMMTLYAHNSVNLVSVGERVTGTSVVALTGSTGHSTGPHLHFEAWRDGANITSSFVGNRQTASYPPEGLIRRSITSDGTLVFTNLP